jgi:hypothetical protein
MKLRSFFILSVVLGCLSIMVAYNAASSFDGTNPPHAVDIAGKTIPESSATQPDKPIILSKDSKDPKWGELKPEKVFNHAKHNSDVKHSADGKTVTACVECHHTEQPSAPPGKPYLKLFNKERTATLTPEQLETSKVPVKSCRACHFQAETPPSGGFPPETPKALVNQLLALQILLSGDLTLTNKNAYHARCLKCHDAASGRDPTVNAPLGCNDCHINKLATPAIPSPASSTTPVVAPTTSPITSPTTSPTTTPSTSPTP